MVVHAAVRLRTVIVAMVAAIGVAVPVYAQEFKAQFVSPLWGLRVQTDTPGGQVGSFGSNGEFVVDAAGIVGGRFAIKENGKVGIGIPNPAQKLSVAGVVESTTGGFKFPDGTIQTSAIATAGNFIQNSSSFQAGASFNIGGSGSVLQTMQVGGLLGVGALSFARFTVSEAADNGTASYVLATGASSVGTLSGGTSIGVHGTATLSTSVGVYGENSAGAGVKGSSTSGIGVVAMTSGPAAVDAVNSATSGFADGVRATSNSGAAVGLWARNFAGGGTAGRFDGNVAVYGTLTKSGGSFKIDHPLDPENKYLSHSFVESPDMMNIYNGNVTTNAEGTAEVTMPSWFQALNEEFRYQLTCIGTFAQAIVFEEIRDNRFVIKTSLPHVKVSWQVTGIRHDPWAAQHRIHVEETKPDSERGYYIHPDVYGQPAERSTAAARSADAAGGNRK